MAAKSLVEQELSDRLDEIHGRLAKLEEARGADKSGGGSGALSARLKSVEGQVTDVMARLDAIQAETPKTGTSRK